MPENLQQRLIDSQAAVMQAREDDDVRRLCLALIDLGTAQFQTRLYDQGKEHLDEATTLAATVDDPKFQAYCLSLKADAYQDIGRYHNAYEVLEEIVTLAAETGDAGIECDVLLTQGQVLINSGEPMIALEKLNEARSLSSRLEDKRYAMKAFGALGNLKVATVELDDAQMFFDMAVMQAVQLGDKQAECGYLLNKGTVIAWQKHYAEAVPVLEQARILAVELADMSAELMALRYLTESSHALNQPARVIPLAQRGLELSRPTENHQVTFPFFQTYALAFFRTEQPEEALRITQYAIEYVTTVDDQEPQTNMLLTLGESCIVMAFYAEALTAYQRALAGLRAAGRDSDEAHVLGRIGVALAELGRIDEAIEHHQQAANMARQHNLPELYAEQHVLMALSYLEQPHTAQARLCCETAINGYSSIGFTEEADLARQVLAQIPD